MTAIGPHDEVVLFLHGRVAAVVSRLRKLSKDAILHLFQSSQRDAEVNFTERVGGVIKARKEMSAMVKGHVLEVSCGTARNLGYYSFDKIKSLTLIDLSPQMVQEARKKWNILNPGKAAENVPIRFLQGDCIGEMPEPPTTQDAAKKSGTTFTPGLAKG